MNPRPLIFAHLVKVLEFNQVALVQSPPAPAKHPYFVGPNKDAAFFPYSSGPVHYLDRPYADAELLPVKLIHSVIKHLKVDRDQFWKDVAAVAPGAQVQVKQPVAKHAEAAQIEVKTTNIPK
jgi:hypothetical protein